MANLVDISYYYEIAKKYKDEIISIYREALEYMDPLTVIDDSATRTAPTRRNIDTDVIRSKNDLKSFIMNSVFSRTNNWASAKINERLYEIINEKGLGTDKNIRTINENLEKDVDDSFVYIQNSDYYNQIAKSVDDLIVLGTGVYKITSTASLDNPFIYEYVGINNLFIVEDSLGAPNIVFKRHYNVNGTYISDVFGKDVTLPSAITEENKEETVNCIECVIPTYDESNSVYKFQYTVILDDFETILLDKELNYNPFVVFRWRTIKNSPWGFGLGIDALDTIKQLVANKELRNENMLKLVRPPMNYIGPKELYYRLSSESGADNYMGEAPIAGVSADYRPANTGIQLLPLDQQIADDKNRVRDIFMTNPLGAPEDSKYTSATAVQIRAEEFRKRFASTYELINSELLKPTFFAPFSILIEKGLLLTSEDNIPVTQITYMNDFTKAAKANKNQKYLIYANTANQLLQLNQSGLIFKNQEVIDTIADNLEIEADKRYTADEIAQIQEAQYQAQLQQLQAQGGEVSGQ